MKKEKDKENPEEEKAGEESGGMTESVLDGVGDLIPGLGGLIKGLKKSDAFMERLDSIDEEIDRKLEETPRRPPSGISPSVARRGTRSKKHFDTFRAGDVPMDKDERDVLVDIFEEENKLRVIAELPGVNEKDIRLDLNQDVLIISANWRNKSYHKKVKLPRTSDSIIGKIYNNGILEVTLN